MVVTVRLFATLRERAGADDGLLVRIRSSDELALAENALLALADLRAARRLVGAEPWLEPIAAAEIAGRDAGGLGAALLLPYLAWVGYAAALNRAIARLNPRTRPG